MTSNNTGHRRSIRNRQKTLENNDTSREKGYRLEICRKAVARKSRLRQRLKVPEQKQRQQSKRSSTSDKRNSSSNSRKQSKRHSVSISAPEYEPKIITRSMFGYCESWLNYLDRNEESTLCEPKSICVPTWNRIVTRSWTRKVNNACRAIPKVLPKLAPKSSAIIDNIDNDIQKTKTDMEKKWTTLNRVRTLIRKRSIQSSTSNHQETHPKQKQTSFRSKTNREATVKRNVPSSTYSTKVGLNSTADNNHKSCDVNPCFYCLKSSEYQEITDSFIFGSSSHRKSRQPFKLDNEKLLGTSGANVHNLSNMEETSSDEPMDIDPNPYVISKQSMFPNKDLKVPSHENGTAINHYFKSKDACPDNNYSNFCLANKYSTTGSSSYPLKEMQNSSTSFSNLKLNQFENISPLPKNGENSCTSSSPAVQSRLHSFTSRTTNALYDISSSFIQEMYTTLNFKRPKSLLKRTFPITLTDTENDEEFCKEDIPPILQDNRGAKTLSHFLRKSPQCLVPAQKISSDESTPFKSPLVKSMRALNFQGGGFEEQNEMNTYFQVLPKSTIETDEQNISQVHKTSRMNINLLRTSPFKLSTAFDNNHSPVLAECSEDNCGSHDIRGLWAQECKPTKHEKKSVRFMPNIRTFPC